VPASPKRITVRVGDALEILSEEKEQYDIIFNDIDKTDYPRVNSFGAPASEKAEASSLRQRLWNGKVSQPNPDAQTKAILEFNKLIYASPDLFTTILPLRDGVSLCVKK